MYCLKTTCRSWQQAAALEDEAQTSRGKQCKCFREVVGFSAYYPRYNRLVSLCEKQDHQTQGNP